MGKHESDIRKLMALRDYYKGIGECSIIGLNDSQGVKTTSFLGKGLLEYLSDALACDGLTLQVIDAFSLLFNKTEHVDYFLKHDLTVSDIKLTQLYSAVSAFRKVMRDVGLPEFLGNVAYAYKFAYSIKPGDEKIKIGTTLKDSIEPLIIYSSGANDLMRAVGSDPFTLQRDFKKKDITPNYAYTLAKSKDPNTLPSVISGIERNFDTILGINPNADIYSLGIYVPKSLQIDDTDKEKQEMQFFTNLILGYNEALENLCEQYGVTYVNTEKFGKSTGDFDFHISAAGRNILANHILELIYRNKIQKNCGFKSVGSLVDLTGHGIPGVIHDISSDYFACRDRSSSLAGYEQEREMKIANEHSSEADVLTKSLIESKKRHL